MNRIEEALALHQAGRYADASRLYCAVLEEKPDDADALNLLASATRSLGDVASALQLVRKAAEIAPFRADIFYNLGNAAQAAGHITDAIEAWQTSVRLDPAHADALANIGVAFGRQGRYAEAVEAYAHALDLQPDHRIAGHNIGNALGELDRGEEATRAFRAAIRHHPDLAEAEYNLSLALLRRGDYTTGFKLYEARWRSADFSHPPRHTKVPNWDGTPLKGKRLLIHSEQGLGDTLQFVRLVRMAATLADTITLEVPTGLQRILKPFADVAEIVGEGKVKGKIDCQTPLLGLPHRLGLTLGSVPAPIPYLQVEPDAASAMQALMQPDHRPMIGLCWRGNPKSPADRGRSIRDIAMLAPLRALKGVRFVSLMKMEMEELTLGTSATNWVVRGAPFPIEHPGPQFDGGADAFIETAALIRLCRAVVTTDTSVTHLAGALGVPTVTMLKKVPDWRWLGEGSATPWYPNMTLVRQAEFGDWLTTVERATEAAREIFSRARASSAKV
jgi:Tfp pilus assembly protein PilF